MRVLTLSAVVSLLCAAPVAAQSYEPVLVEPQIAGTPATMTPLQLGDDSTAKIDLGFDFTYWGQTFSSAWVSSNGFVSFGTSANLCCNGQPIEQAPRNTIYGMWTDLISWSNPYYARSEGSILFGWYDTQEYGTQNRFTFEIGLSSDNKIRINYGNLAPLTYHMATAGITGPGADDNIQLFYGRDPSGMRYQSGVLAWTEPKVTVDCAATPLDPSCPPQATQSVQAAPIETIQDAYAADVQADQSDIAAVAMSEPEQEIDITVPAEETRSESVVVQVAEAVAAERLTPDQVAALAAPTVELPLPGAGVTVQFGAAQGGTGVTGSAAPAAFGAVFETLSPSSNSPSSVANTLEVLNMSSAPAPQASVAQTDQQTGSAMSEGQNETMAAIAAVPGFSAYTRVALQDRPDFYALRDIYRNRRLRDANFEMYRMTQSNTSKWQEMVDEQNER